MKILICLCRVYVFKPSWYIKGVCSVAENDHEVCAVMSRISQHYEQSLPGSACMYAVNGSNACKNCLDLNCTIPIMISDFAITITVRSEVSVLPCYDGNLNVPNHAIESRILDENGRQLYGRLSTQSFNDSFKLTIVQNIITVTPFILANIENRGDGVFFQVRLE